jgi:DNA invertase Pin-like site-specific DNA recombinase
LPRVVGYLRVSTEDQAREGHSLAAQEERIRAWARALGAGRPVVVFRDEGISGCRMDRPGLRAAVDSLGRGDALVVYSLSRLARSTRGTLELAEELEKRGADLVSLSERIDTTTAAGRMVFRMLAVLAEFERDQTAERVRGVLASKKARGERVSRFPELSAAVCARAWELWAGGPSLGGLSLRAVGRALDAEGLATAGGKAWSAKVVRDAVAKGDGHGCRIKIAGGVTAG